MTKHSYPTTAARGLTLIELLTVIALVGILAFIAIPNFRETIKDNQVTGQHNELVAIISYARSEAIRRSRFVTVEITPDPNVAAWEARVYTLNTNENTADTVLRQLVNQGVNIVVTPNVFTFNSRGYVRNEANPDGGSLNPLSIEIQLEHEDASVSRERQRRSFCIRPTGQLVPEPTNGCNPT